MSKRVKIFQPHLSTVSDARAVRTREALRQALLELLTLKSLEQITIRDIAAEAGIGYTTFFRHHPTKASLLDDLAAEQIRKLFSLVMPAMDPSNVRAANKAMFAYVDEQRDLWATLLTGGAASALRAEFLRLCREIAATWPRRSAWPPEEVVTLLVVSGTVELLSWWLAQEQPVSIEEIVEIHDRLIVKPAVKSQDGARPKSVSTRSRNKR